MIHAELAECREKHYDTTGNIYNRSGWTITATLCGGLARYINHSCSPSCVA